MIDTPRLSDEPAGCIGDLTLADVHLDQVRQAIFERVERIDQIPALLNRLNQTDWAGWLADMGGRIVVCAGCGRYARSSDTIRLPELTWLDEAVFCHACGEQVLAQHTFVCDVCGHDFHARTPPAPFAVCPGCDSPGIAFAASSLAAQLLRAERLGLPATLTLRQWLDTLEYFGWRCAYCRRADFACMDHFVPVIEGGGTTQGNCVPACVSCNSAKGGRNPHGAAVKPESYPRVARYLAQHEP